MHNKSMISFFALTETWLHAEGYRFIHLLSCNSLHQFLNYHTQEKTSWGILTSKLTAQIHSQHLFRLN